MNAQERYTATVKALLVIIRDALSFIGGWALMLKQAGIFFPPPEEFQFWVLAVGALVAGVPGFAQVLAWRFGGTAGSPSPPQVPPEPSPAPSSSIT